MISGNSSKNGTRRDPLDPEAFPDRYPFVTLRREHFGGILFNRFLSYTRLDPIQARVLEHCTGSLAVRQIQDVVATEFRLAPVEAHQRLEAAFEPLDQLYAVHWRDSPKDESHVPPRAGICHTVPGSPALSAPIYVLWDITYACNLRCSHCAVNAGEQVPKPMSLDQVCRVIDQLVDMRVLYVSFVGGEPFMRRDMLDILSYASQHPIGVIVTTNGVLVDDSLVNQLADLNIFDVQISLDGLEGTHDSFRGVPGVFSKATQAVRRLSEAGFRTTINTVMTKLNHGELERMVELAVSLGATSYKAVAFVPVGRGRENSERLLLAPDQLRESILRLRSLQSEYEGVISIVTEENYPLVSQGEPTCKPANCYQVMGCAAGISQLVLDPEGKVYACPFLHSQEAGDLRHQTVQEIWAQSDALDAFRHVEKAKLKGKCHTCQYAPTQCRGGCRAAAYAVTGDFWAEDPLCWH